MLAKSQPAASPSTRAASSRIPRPFRPPSTSASPSLATCLWKRAGPSTPVVGDSARARRIPGRPCPGRTRGAATWATDPIAPGLHRTPGLTWDPPTAASRTPGGRWRRSPRFVVLGQTGRRSRSAQHRRQPDLRRCDRANGTGSAQSGAGGSIWLTVGGDVSRYRHHRGRGRHQHRLRRRRRRDRAGVWRRLLSPWALSTHRAGTRVRPGVPAPSCSAALHRPSATSSSTTRGASASRPSLPALGSGIAQAGSSGITLITDKTSIPAYFVGHWVEVSSPDGTVEGTWQVVAIDGSTLTLDDGATVDVGDSWQGVYRFDRVTIRGSGRLSSSDPIRSATASFEGGSTGDGAAMYSTIDVSGLLEVSGPIRARQITAGSLTVHSGGKLSHPSTVSSAEQPQCHGHWRRACGRRRVHRRHGSRIWRRHDVSRSDRARAYTGGSHRAYGPMARAHSRGSDLRQRHPTPGGWWLAEPTARRYSGCRVAESFGSTSAAPVICDGAIRANGTGSASTGAGGSVWSCRGRRCWRRHHRGQGRPYRPHRLFLGGAVARSRWSMAASC